MEWLYNGHKITELPAEVIGFTYCIYYTDGTKYIGKKLAKSERRKKPLKGMRVNAKRMVMTEHNWRDYEGSSKLTKYKEIQTKVIVHLCTSKTTLTYLEQKEMFAVDAALNTNYVNENIGGKFYDTCLRGLYSGEVIQKHLFNQG